MKTTTLRSESRELIVPWSDKRWDCWLTGPQCRESMALGHFPQETRRVLRVNPTRAFQDTWTPYVRWQDAYPTRWIDEQLEISSEENREDCGQSTYAVLVTHHHRSWNEDPQPLVAVRRWRDQGVFSSIGVRVCQVDPWSAMDLIRDGWVDFVHVPFGPFDQRAAAGLLPLAMEHGVQVVAENCWWGLLGDAAVPNAEKLLEEINPGEIPLLTAIRFALNTPGIAAVRLDDEQLAINEETAKLISQLPDAASLSEDIMRSLRHPHWHAA
ncbi:MAG: hypothetical protein AAF664_16435 [Planctomycetota bacterium]